MKNCRETQLNDSPFGFTLIELVVTLAIISILASLMLAGITGAAHRNKREKTLMTLRKLSESVLPEYETYSSKRVTVSTTGTAALRERTQRLRLLAAQELPQRWAEVYTPATLPTSATTPMRAYAQYRDALAVTGPGATIDHEGAECLAMIIMRGPQGADFFSQFRPDEMGDRDSDGAIEFLDGWGNPIAFLRWPTGFRSPIQTQDASLQPDPFDPMRVSDPVLYPSSMAAPQRDYAVFPLIISKGADGVDSQQGIAPDPIVWTALLTTGTAPGTLRFGSGPLAGEVIDPAAAADNISNHDLSR